MHTGNLAETHTHTHKKAPPTPLDRMRILSVCVIPLTLLLVFVHSAFVHVLFIRPHPHMQLTGRKLTAQTLTSLSLTDIGQTFGLEVKRDAVVKPNTPNQAFMRFLCLVIRFGTGWARVVFVPGNPSKHFLHFCLQ